MQIVVSARHGQVPEDVRAYIIEKAGKLDRFYDRIQAIEVIVIPQGNRHEVEMIVTVDRSPPFVIRKLENDVLASVDSVVKHMEEQLRRHKERLRNRKHPEPGPELSE